MAEKRRRRRRYEAIGGPICGQRLEGSDDGWLGIEEFSVGGGAPEEHWYRLCVIEDGRGKRAKFWHYIGAEPEDIVPWLVPAEKHFK